MSRSYDRGTFGVYTEQRFLIYIVLFYSPYRLLARWAFVSSKHTPTPQALGRTAHTRFIG